MGRTNIPRIAFCLALTCASLTIADADAKGQAALAWQMPVEGCMNSWVSNGTWAVRVTDVRNLADRLDIALTWRNDSKATMQPAGTNSPMGFHGFSITYAGPYGTGGSDSLGMLDTVQSHPARTALGNDLLLRQFAPGSTYKTVLHFYYPETYNATTQRSTIVPVKHKPIAFLADTVIAPSQRCTSDCLSPIKVKLNCPSGVK